MSCARCSFWEYAPSIQNLLRYGMTLQFLVAQLNRNVKLSGAVILFFRTQHTHVTLEIFLPGDVQSSKEKTVTLKSCNNTQWAM